MMLYSCHILSLCLKCMKSDSHKIDWDFFVERKTNYFFLVM